MHSHLKFQLWFVMLTRLSFCKQVVHFSFFILTSRQPSEGLTSCMPAGHSSEGVQAGCLHQLGKFLSPHQLLCIMVALLVNNASRQMELHDRLVNCILCMGLPAWGKTWGAAC